MSQDEIDKIKAEQDKELTERLSVFILNKFNDLLLEKGILLKSDYDKIKRKINE